MSAQDSPKLPQKPAPKSLLRRLIEGEGEKVTCWHPHVYNRNEGNGPWWKTAEWYLAASVRGVYVNSLLKGWWHLGPRGYINGTAKVEAAVGGEDNMLQLAVTVPWLAHVAVGVRVPRWLTKSWVYERRTIGLTVGGHDLVDATLGYDDTAEDMRSYYKKLRDDPKGGQCASCNAPGYCHDISPPDDHLLYGARLTIAERPGLPGLPSTPAREQTLYFTAPSPQSAQEYFDARWTGPGNESLQAQLLGPEPLPRFVKAWSAIGTEHWSPIASCKGWAKRVGYVPTRVALWPGWHFRRPLYPVVDWLLGPMVHASEPFGTYPVFKDGKPLGLKQVVSMPEGNYPCRVILRDDTWERKRWPFSRKAMRRADVDLEVPIPVPGKGENSYDLDDDATFSATLPANSIAEALGKVAQNALEVRERRASRSWTPDNGWPRGIVAR